MYSLSRKNLVRNLLRDILIILVLALSVSAVIIPKELNDLDELWNYNFARNIADGLLPYNGFNMVTTPLLSMICGMILNLTFNELIVMRVLAVCLITAILYITYKVFELLEINQYVTYILLICMYMLMENYFRIDYNFGVLLIALITLYYELKQISRGKELVETDYKDIFIGILVGSSILFKQTTGVFLSAIFVSYKLLLVNRERNIKNILKIIGIRLLGVIIPIIGFSIYVSVNGIWNDFLDYTVYSLNTFSNKISYLNLINGNYGIHIAILSILVPAMIITMFIIFACKKLENKQCKNIFILFAYSIATFIVVYPISDSIHFLIGAFCTLIGSEYFGWLLLKNNQFSKGQLLLLKCVKYLFFLIALIIISYSVVALTSYIKTCTEYKNLKHFKYIPVLSENVQIIDDYIIEQNKQGKDVYILDATAALYMIPLDKYNKDYDMFNIGNIGSRGEEGQIDKLESIENTILLIMNDKYKRNWQNPERVRRYIMESWVKTGEIQNFDIYEKY